MFNKEEIAKFNNQSMGEEIANAISHGVGTLLAIAGTVIAIVSAMRAALSARLFTVRG